MAEIRIADWVQKVAGDKAPLADLREWEPRIVAAYSELLDGYKADIGAILNDIAKVRDHPGLVLEQGINFTSVCYHHFLPFYGPSTSPTSRPRSSPAWGGSSSWSRRWPTGSRSRSSWSGTSPKRSGSGSGRRGCSCARGRCTCACTRAGRATTPW